MKTKKQLELVSSKIISKEDLKKNKGTVEFYRHHQKTKDILERTAIALGRKKVYKFKSASTSSYEINHHGRHSTKETYKN